MFCSSPTYGLCMTKCHERMPISIYIMYIVVVFLLIYTIMRAKNHNNNVI